MVPVGPHTPSPCSRPDLAARLVEFDELAPNDLASLRAHAAACPSCGPKFQVLVRAERWLDSQRPGAVSGDCPPAEELYDFANAPGAAPLAPERERAVALHTRSCAECGSFLATLQSRPAAPLILDPLPDGAPLPLEILTPSAGREPLPIATRRPTRRWVVPLAAAASLLAAVYIWGGSDISGTQAAGTDRIRYPGGPVLRGDQGGALLFPRGPLLADGAGKLVHGIRFEVVAPPGAEHLRVEVQERGADPLAPGREVLALEGAALEQQDAVLPVGDYTWEAWVRVDGLDRPLGRRDFEVRSDARTSEELVALAKVSEPARSSEALRLLSERGYVTDARTWARGLPPSPERDAFLARLPGR